MLQRIIMKLASWNINSIKARTDNALKWLKNAKPDVVFFQELKTDGEHYPFDKIEELGYISEIRGQKGYAGVATLIKKELEHTLISTELFEEGDEQARFIEIEVNGTRMINIYAPNGNPSNIQESSEKYDFKLRWYERLEEKLFTYLKQEQNVLIGGDFNIIPEDKDCYDPMAWKDDALFTQEVRKTYRRLINAGFTDSFRVFNQNADEYTFWDYQAGAWQRGNGIRIDHFLTSPKISDQLKSCTIDKEPRGWDKPSDHTPIIIEI